MSLLKQLLSRGRRKQTTIEASWLYHHNKQKADYLHNEKSVFRHKPGQDLIQILIDAFHEGHPDDRLKQIYLTVTVGSEGNKRK